MYSDNVQRSNARVCRQKKKKKRICYLFQTILRNFLQEWGGFINERRRACVTGDFDRVLRNKKMVFSKRHLSTFFIFRANNEAVLFFCFSRHACDLKSKILLNPVHFSRLKIDFICSLFHVFHNIMRSPLYPVSSINKHRKMRKLKNKFQLKCVHFKHLFFCFIFEDAEKKSSS